MSSNVDLRALSQLDEASRTEMMQWVQNELSQAKMRSTIHGFTDMCFRKCVSNAQGSLNHPEEECLKNCLNRFLDTNAAIIKKIQEQNK